MSKSVRNYLSMLLYPPSVHDLLSLGGSAGRPSISLLVEGCLNDSNTITQYYYDKRHNRGLDSGLKVFTQDSRSCQMG